MVKSIILMRHAEREDRALEAQGHDWISTAPRPQDPKLSPAGCRQAAEVGRQLRSVGVTRILSSPMIRTVMTSDIIAEVLGLGEKSICVEYGLVEEAKSFRGKTASEPRPNWEPLVLPVCVLTKHSSRIDTSYKALQEVIHVRDESKPNTVREHHDTLTDRDQITRDRCKQTLLKILLNEEFKDDVVLCVGHGATVLSSIMVLEAELAPEDKIKGERSVSCFAEFQPVDPANPLGPWKSVTGTWGTGNIFGDSAEDAADKGL
eukprot:gene35426-42940_t